MRVLATLTVIPDRRPSFRDWMFKHKVGSKVKSVQFGLTDAFNLDNNIDYNKLIPKKDEQRP